MSDAIGVVGVDGKTPVYNPSARFTIWSISEIYRGDIAANRYIPRVSDWVVEPETGTVYIVTDFPSNNKCQYLP